MLLLDITYIFDISLTLISQFVSSKLSISKLELVKNIAALACQLNERLDELFEEDTRTTDMNKGHLLYGKSRIANNGDYTLHCFTRSGIYSFL